MNTSKQVALTIRLRAAILRDTAWTKRGALEVASMSNTQWSSFETGREPTSTEASRERLARALWLSCGDDLLLSPVELVALEVGHGEA